LHRTGTTKYKTFYPEAVIKEGINGSGDGKWPVAYVLNDCCTRLRKRLHLLTVGVLLPRLFPNGIELRLALGAIWPRLHGYYDQGLTSVSDLCRLPRVETKCC
jgi:hypothetical protein